MASTAKKPKVDEENQRSVDEKESEALEQIDNFQGEVRKKWSFWLCYRNLYEGLVSKIIML